MSTGAGRGRGGAGRGGRGGAGQGGAGWGGAGQIETRVYLGEKTGVWWGTVDWPELGGPEQEKAE